VIADTITAVLVYSGSAALFGACWYYLRSDK